MRKDGRDRTEYYRNYYQANKDQWRERREANPPAYRKGEHYRSRYGVTKEEVARMLAEQGGVCAICAGPPNGRWKTLQVDHCHTTGKIRGLLCWRCNVMLGYKEQTTWQSKADAYLERNLP